MKSEQTNDFNRFARIAGAFIAFTFVFALGLIPSAAFAGELDGDQASSDQPVAIGTASILEA